MTHLIRLSLRDSRKLLRVQWEATRGTIPPKAESAAIKLADNHSVAELTAISWSVELPRRSLPHTVEKAFTQWREHRGATTVVDVECRWDDAVAVAQVSAIGKASPSPSPAASGPVTPTFEGAAPDAPVENGVATVDPPQQHTTLSVVGPPLFPFNLPEGFQPVVEVVDEGSERE